MTEETKPTLHEWVIKNDIVNKAWCEECEDFQYHHGDPDSIHLHLCNVCNCVVEY